MNVATKEHLSSENPIGQFREKVTALGHNAKNVAQETMDALGSKASDYWRQGYSRVQHMEKTAEARISEHPLRAVAIAAGVGLLLGMIWRRQ